MMSARCLTLAVSSACAACFVMGCVAAEDSGARDDRQVTTDFGDHVAIATSNSDGSVSATLVRKVDGASIASLDWASGLVAWNVVGIRDGAGATHTFAMAGESSPLAAADLVERMWKFASAPDVSVNKQNSAITCSGETEDFFDLDGYTCLARCKVLEDCTTITSFSCVLHQE
jgi:hypothetical protein